MSYAGSTTNSIESLLCTTSLTDATLTFASPDETTGVLDIEIQAASVVEAV
jgi:hypothetical protein